MKVRINRYISMCGYTSRRKADELIDRGLVFVNDSPVKEPGLSVDTLNDTVRVGDDELSFENKRYILLNKPKLYLTTLANNEDDKKTIMELITDVPERVYPVGRLDYDVEGLLFLTNDGELAHKLHHPSYTVPKEYVCVLNTKISLKDIESLKKGAKLEDGFIVPDKVKLSKSDQSSNVIVITFHEGKNHLVKRYLSYFGFKIIKLKRVSIGPLNLGDLKKGQWRDLSKKEMSTLLDFFN
jgi:23S rRNA pseudouridine2605 synthase